MLVVVLAALYLAVMVSAMIAGGDPKVGALAFAIGAVLALVVLLEAVF